MTTPELEFHLSRAAVALAWRIAFATAIMPIVLLPGFVGHYPIATVGTMGLLAAGIPASAVAVASMIRAQMVRRRWLAIAAGIGAWAAFDAVLLREVWLVSARVARLSLDSDISSVNLLPASSTFSAATWVMPALGIIAIIAFAWLVTPGRRRLHVTMLLAFAAWFMLHHLLFFECALLIEEKDLSLSGYYGAVIYAAPLELLLIALSVTLTVCAVRVARSLNPSAPRPLPRAIARNRPSAGTSISDNE